MTTERVCWAFAAVILLMIVWAHQVKADELYLGAWSKHFTGGDYNEVHNMVGVNYDSWVAAYFKNSYERHTVLIGKDFRWSFREVHAGVMVGGTFGYRECYGDNGGSAKVCPFLAPYLGYDAQVSPKLVFTHQMAAIVGTVQF